MFMGKRNPLQEVTLLGLCISGVSDMRWMWKILLVWDLRGLEWQGKEGKFEQKILKRGIAGDVRIQGRIIHGKMF